MDKIIMERVQKSDGTWEAECYCEVCGEGWTEEMAQGKHLDRYTVELWHQSVEPSCYEEN